MIDSEASYEVYGVRLYRIDEQRAARCFLYQDQPVLETADVAETFILAAAAKK